MIKNKHKIIVSVSGASGSIYAKVLFDKLVQLKEQIEVVGVLMSDNSKYVWETELDNSDYNNYPFTFYDKMDFMAPFASGSANFGTMIICPCSMGTMGRIAAGISNDLTTRAADVILKERRKLIIVARETPLSLIHINNMKIITEAGGIICPATPSFYSKPKTFEALAATVIDRVLTITGLDNKSYSWGAKQ
ncbi:MAG: 4-hydroxy-3-polyprenylbenzoate decarboxylase [bacterium]|jgi:4-hydroxy-3-polyprenylbenzoate decarboxylase